MSEFDKMLDQQQALLNKMDASVSSEEAEIAKALTFYIDGKVYGLEISNVREILNMSHITKVPGVPDYIKGVINVRSKVVPVINVRKRFGKEEIPYDEKTNIIVVEYKDIAVGIIVDQVLDVLSVTEAVKAEVPSVEKVNANKFIQYILNMPDGIKMVLDVKKLILDNEFILPTDEE